MDRPVNTENRKEADALFKKHMATLDHYGTQGLYGEKVNRSVNGKDYNEKIREAQREAKRIIDYKMKDNRKRGRTYNDGHDY